MVVATLLLAAPASAQVGAPMGGASNSIGVIAGLNLASVSFDPSIDSVLDDFGFADGGSLGRKGIAAGIAFQRALTPKVNLRIHGLFSQVGLGFEADAGNNGFAATAGGATPAGAIQNGFRQQINLNQFNIDALVNLPVGEASKVCINAGMFFAFNIGQTETVTEFFDGEEDEFELEGDDQTDIKSNAMGLAFGAEVHATPQISVGALYRLGLTNIDASVDDEGATFNSVKPRVILVYVIFRIGG
jgi:hypothetical protein